MNQETIERAARAIHLEDWEPGASEWDKIGNFRQETYRRKSEAAFAAIHPTVDSVEELDALPEGSVIRFIDITPTVAVKDDEGTWCGSHGLNYYGWYDDDPSPVPFPATVLHFGGAA